MSAHEFGLDVKLNIRGVKAEDANDLHAYCMSSQNIDELTENLKNDLKQIKKGELLRVVASASGHAIGQIRVEGVNGDVATLSELHVSAPFRAFGIADKLINFVENEVRSSGVKQIQIEVDKSELVIVSAYKKWGFIERPTVILQKELVELQSASEKSSSTDATKKVETKSGKSKTSSSPKKESKEPGKLL